MNKQQKLEIASLINTLQVAEINKCRAEAVNDWNSYNLFKDREGTATIELYEIHGIELVNVHHFIEDRKA